MRSISDTVTVYGYMAWNTSAGSYDVAPVKTTLDRIREDEGAQPLLGTALEVAREALDAEGNYRLRPTGWAEFLARADD